MNRREQQKSQSYESVWLSVVAPYMAAPVPAVVESGRLDAASIAARASVLSREKRALLKSILDVKRYIISKSLRDKATCTKLHCGIAPRGFALPHPAPVQCDPVHKPQCLPACLHRGQGKRAERTHLLKKGRTLQQCKL